MSKWGLLLILCISETALAQSTLGVVLGTVRDSSGAVVVGATVRLTNVGTNTSRDGKCDDTGGYEFLDVEPGLYSVTVSQQGFQTFVATQIAVAARQTVRLDATLKVGDVSQTVEVQAASAGIIATDTPVVASTLTSEKVLYLPANIRAGGSTSPYALIALLPGVQADNSNNFSIQGGLPAQSESSVDGISTQKIRDNVPNPVAFPSVESIAEIKVQGAGGGAEYGTPGDITTISKNGTNEFHGALFWYHQNNAFDARSFGQTSLPHKVGNTFGGTVGGPVRLPKLYDGRNHTFFYFTWESMRFPRQTTIQNTVPTQRMRQGDFSQEGVTVIDPLNGQPFPGDVVPPTRFDSVAQAILPLYPLPNVGNGQSLSQANYINNVRADIDSDQYDLRLDHYFGSGHTIFGRYTHKKNQSISPNTLLLPSDTLFNNFQQVVFGDTYTIRPNLLNEFRAGISYAPTGGTFPFNGLAFTNSLTLSDIPRNIYYNALPDFEIDQMSAFSKKRIDSPVSRNTQFMDNLTWIHGRHTIKVGADIRRPRTDLTSSFNTGNTYGTFNFDGSFTGAPFADFLLGSPVSTGVAIFTRDYGGYSVHYKLYVQDTYRVSPRLTLDYGLRWEFDPPFVDPSFQFANFDPSVPVTGRVIIDSAPQAQANLDPSELLSINACPAASINGVPCTPIVTAKAAGLPEGLRKNYYRGFLPRLGFAYRVSDKTTIRGNFGMYEMILLGRLWYEMEGNMYSDVRSFSNVGANGQPLFQLPQTRPVNSNGVVASQVGTSVFDSGANIDFTPPYMMQWNFSVERELTHSIGLRLSYIGNRSVHLAQPVDLNQPPSSTTFFSLRPLTDRPFPNWLTTGVDEPIANADYNSFQAEVRRRFSSGLTFTSAYTLAKDLSDDWSQRSAYAGEAGGSRLANSLDIRSNWGDVYATRRQRLVTTLVYDLPFGKGRTLLSKAHGLTEAVLGGWNLSSILTVQTGPFLTPIFTGGDPSGTDAPDRGPQRPDRIGNGSVSNPTANMWLDRTAFVCPGRTQGSLQFNCAVGVNPSRDPAPIGRFGNSGVGIVTGPGTNNWNLGLSKRFELVEKVFLRLEGSFTNVLNLVNLADPNLTLNNNAFGKITSVRSVDFGGGRTGQVSVRLEF